MDVGTKLIEIENRYYLMLVKELNEIGISPTVGSIILQSICSKIQSDALAVVTSENLSLEEELKNKMKEIEEYKAKDISI